MRKLLVVIFSLLCLNFNAQHDDHRKLYSHDIGFFLGGSYYTGDLNPRKHFASTQLAGGVFYRFNLNSRLAFRAGVNYGSLQGDDSQTDEIDQIERNLNFKTNLYEANGLVEFNFFDYAIGHSKFVFSPYLYLGIAGYHFKPMGNYGNQWYSLQDLSTEGQGTLQNPDQKQYKLNQISVPFGLGFKLNMAKRFGLGFEWGPRKCFTDYIDDVSKSYVNSSQLAAEKGALAGFFSDRSTRQDLLSGNAGKARGNQYIKDWYYYFGFTLNFRLIARPKACNAYSGKRQ